MFLLGKERLFSFTLGTLRSADQAAPCTEMVLRSIPQDTPIRVVGDVHGDATAFAYAAATDRFVVQLGDLTDYGPDSATTLRIMFDLIDGGRGLFLLGNHDLKLARALAGPCAMRRGSRHGRATRRRLARAGDD